MRWATDRVILAAGWLWFLVYAFPGYMSYDSVWQLSQARQQEPLNEWHPPMMAFIWRLTDAVIAGPFPMLVLQSVTFLVGLYALLRHVMPGRVAAIVSVVVLLLPQNITVMAVIWKDSQMAGFLLAGIAALLSDKRRWRIAGCVFIFLATAVRYNAAAATLPIVALLWDRRAEVPWLKRYAIATGVWLALTVAAFVVNGQLVEKRVYPWQTAAAPLDIIGTLRFAELDNDQLLRETPGVPWAEPQDTAARIRKYYRPNASFLDLTQGPAAIIDYPSTDAHRSALTAVWRSVVLVHPGAFVRHRLGVFRAQLAARALIWTRFTNAETSEDLVHHRAEYSAIQLAWISVMQRIDQTWLFHVGLYFVLALALLPFCRRERLAFVMLMSAIGHEVGLLLVAPAIDYRYSHWMVVATLIAAIILFARRRARS